jgi:hypothetical protein
MKNWEEFVCGPRLAIAKRPGEERGMERPAGSSAKVVDDDDDDSVA